MAGGRTVLKVTLLGLLACLPLCAGIVISRSEQGLQFADAVSVIVNGKDKMSSLGEQPTASGPLSKLPNAKVSGILLKDKDSGVVAEYAGGKAEYLVPQGLAKGSPEIPPPSGSPRRLRIKASDQDKAGTEVPPAAFVAFLPGGVEELVRLCTDGGARR